MPFTPAIQIQQLRDTQARDMALFSQGMGQLTQGLAAITQQKEQRATDSVLSRLSKATSRNEVQSMLLELEQSRADKPSNILSALGEMINLGAPYRGMTGAERQVRGGILNDVLNPRRDPYEGLSQADRDRARRIKLGFEPRARIRSEVDPLKELITRRNLLAKQINSKKDEGGYPRSGEGARVRILEKEIKKVDAKIYRQTIPEKKISPLSAKTKAGRAKFRQTAKLNKYMSRYKIDNGRIKVQVNKKWGDANDMSVRNALNFIIKSKLLEPEDQQELNAILALENPASIRQALAVILQGE